MPQETNLNVAPYFDDFDSDSNYYKVLFKPAFPVQARELNNLQSILQNQIEDVGSHLFKEGSVVIPGQITYLSAYSAIQIESEFLGIPISLYLDKLIGKIIEGETSGVKAKIINSITDSESDRDNYTLYLEYLESGFDGSTSTFLDNEVLLTQDSINYATTFIASGEGFAKTISLDASAVGSAFGINEGIYFLRGYFVEVKDQILILDQYTNTPSYRIGLNVTETLVSSDVDPKLNDNAAGFNNYTAPGADRLKIEATLAKKLRDDFNDENFVQLADIQAGLIRDIKDSAQYNELGRELAKRTFDESGHYYVSEFVTSCHESLNNGFGNRGIYEPGQTTQQGNTPSDDLFLYKVSPGKAYVRGYEVDIKSATFLDAKKPRTTNKLENQQVNFGFGPSFKINNAYGSAAIGFNTTNTLSLRSQRVGYTTAPAGKEIGVARIYDSKLDTGTYVSMGGTIPATNQWDLSLFDIQTYSEFTLNEPITLTVPTYIEGQSSGARAYLRHTVNVGTSITAYDIKGNFSLGEKLEFNGIGNSSRTAIAYTAYNISDIQSVFGFSQYTGTGIGFGTYLGDLVPSSMDTIGVVSITPYNVANGQSQVSSNIAGLTSSFGVSGAWPGIVTVGNLVRFSQQGQSLPTLATVDVVNTTNIVISGVTTVPGVVSGTMPGIGITVSDFEVVGTVMENQTGSGNAASNESLYSIFPKKNIKSVDVSDTDLVIRKSYTSVIANNSTSSISPEPNCVFLPFDEERYTIIGSDGTLESITRNQLVFEGSGSIRFDGLSRNDVEGATVITTQRQSTVTAKVKNNNIVSSLVIDKSNNVGSGIGSTTLQDGLTYGNFPFGTRVQDSMVCLNVPDVIMLYGIFESSDTEDPSTPSMTTGSMSGSTATTNDLIIGDQIIGKISKAKALYISRINDSSINFIYQTNTLFESGETVDFVDSGVNAVATNLTPGDENILGDFKFRNGQKSTIYDYSRIIRKSGAPAPTNRLKVYYESASYDSSDTGDITLANSYDNFDYTTQISVVDGIRNTELIDARPRVNDYEVTQGARSPFEFHGRVFDNGQNSSKNVLATDESITVAYDYYLGRLDRIYLNTKGVLSVIYGEPADNPTLPDSIPGTLNLATVALPAYLYNARNVKVSFISHKRYQMSDISKLEQRIKNLEYYTALNTLETNTLNQHITDANGLDRFKSGVFVDDFTSFGHQDPSVGVRNSIDVAHRILRPAHFTTQVNMEIGNDSIVGLGTTTTSNQDARFANIIGTNVKVEGDVAMLDYDEVSWYNQQFATRSESVTPFLVRYWEGSIALTPTADVWIQVTQMALNRVEMEGSFAGVAQAMQAEVTTGADGTRTGVSPVIWGSWETVGVNVSMDLSSDQASRSATSMRSGTRAEFLEVSSDAQFMNFVNIQDPWTNTNRAQGEVPPNFRVQEETITTTNTIGGSTSVGLNQQRTGTVNTVNEVIESASLGNRVVNRSIINFCRDRNIQFVGRRLKPYTRLYSFFDNVVVTDHCVPKLIEIAMTSGTFQVGETVTGTMPSTQNSTATATVTTPSITFRVANSNHKYGEYNSPTDVYDMNPYDRGNSVPATYSTSSSTLNVDTESLARESGADSPLFKGEIASGMILVGGTSGAQATVNDLRLMTDRLGTLIGCFHIPDPANAGNNTFATGRNTFRLTDSSINSLVQGLVLTSAEEIFYSQGDLDTAEQTTLALRNAGSVTRATQTDTRDSVSGSDSASTSWETQTTRLTGEYTDPLAQSFSVGSDDAGGIYLSSVDLRFQAIPEPNTANSTVTVQLREMDLGTPTQTVLAYSEVEKFPEDIIISDDASAVTNFKFHAPVYLASGSEYCLAILSASTDYRVFISRLGEVDIPSSGSTESGQVLVSVQPLLGSLFKSQNASTWTPSQYEDLTFQFYRADFNSEGSVQFFNPQLPIGDQSLKINPITPYPQKVRVGLGTVVNTTTLVEGCIVTQAGTDGQGQFVGYAGSASGTLNLISAGIGYTPTSGGYTFTGVALTSITGSGYNGVADVTIQNGVAVAATINGYVGSSQTGVGNGGGAGYQVGDVVGVQTFGGSFGVGALGSGVRFSIGSIFGNNEIALTNVQGTFGTGAGQQLFYNGESNAPGVGIGSTMLNFADGGTIPQSPIRVTNDGLHAKVFCRNHGMYSSGNVVKLADVSGGLANRTTLSSNYPNTGTGDITIGSTANFGTFENIGIAVSNPGYVKIGNEIISYTGFGPGGESLTGITRGVNNTTSTTHSQNDIVYKYEMAGVSLFRINTTHNLNEVESSLQGGPETPLTLDSYNVKVDMSSGDNATDRTGSSTFPALKFTSGLENGGVSAKSTYNIPFAMVKPKWNITAPTGTSLRSSIRTVSGTSISGSESSFVDKGFQSLSLNQENWFNSPRIVASSVNESQYLTALPAKKSLTVNVNLATRNTKLSPMIDLDQTSLVFTSNRVNAPVGDYSTNLDVKTTDQDPNRFFYVTKNISLENEATSLQVAIDAYLTNSCDIRVFYSLSEPGDVDDAVFVPFPGYNNLNPSRPGIVVDPVNNDGSSDVRIPTQDNFASRPSSGMFNEYRFTADRIPSFTNFRIKVIGTSTNQAFAPQFSNLRVLALA